MLTTTLLRLPARLRASRTRLKWPSCKYPIVGTRPMSAPARCHFLASRCMAATVFTICITIKVTQDYETINLIVKVSAVWIMRIFFSVILTLFVLTGLSGMQRLFASETNGFLQEATLPADLENLLTNAD